MLLDEVRRQGLTISIVSEGLRWLDTCADLGDSFCLNSLLLYYVRIVSQVGHNPRATSENALYQVGWLT